MATLKNRNDLQAQAANTLPDNTTQAISPQDVREMVENLAESNFNKITDGPLVGLKPYNTGVIYEAGQGANYNGNLYFANKTTTLGAFNPADWDLFASEVSELNDLSDVNTGLPGTPTVEDQGKILFYDQASGDFITDDIITSGTVVINGKKASAGTIAKGKPVYLVGFDADLHTVEEANAGAAGTMPVIGFAAEDMDATNAKKITTFGKLTGVDTSAYTLGSSLYMDTTTGALTATRPTGAGSLVQRIAKVLKVDASGGQIFIFNTARTAGLPNLAQDNVWLGDANGHPQAVNKNTLGGNSIYTADGTVSAARLVDLDDNKLTFDVGTLASGSSNTIGLRIDGSNIFYGGGSGSSPLFIVDSDLGNVLNVNSGGFLISTSDYTNSIAQFKNRAGTQGLYLKNNVSDIASTQFRHLATNSDTTDRIDQAVTSSYQQWLIAKNNVINHWIRNGDSAAQACFFITGVTGRGFNVGGGDDIDGEKISLQDRTAIKGAGTGTGTTLALYDNDTTPNKTWEWLDNGNVNVNQATEVNTSNTFNFKNGTKQIGINSWNTHAYWAINNGTTAWSLISANSSSTFNADEFGIANGSLVPIRIYNGTSVALGGVIKANLNTAYLVQTNGDTLIGGDLHATDGANILQFDFNNYPKVKIGTAAQEWWIIEGDGTGSTFNNGDLYIYDSTGAIKLVQFKQSGGGVLLGGDLDMNNNRIKKAIVNPEVQEAASSATFTINADQESMGVLTAMAANTTIAAPTGTPVQGQKLMLRLKDDGTSRTLTFNAIFRAIGVTLPTATTANKTLYLGLVYNSTDTKWDVLAVKEEA